MSAIPTLHDKPTVDLKRLGRILEETRRDLLDLDERSRVISSRIIEEVPEELRFSDIEECLLHSTRELLSTVSDRSPELSLLPETLAVIGYERPGDLHIDQLTMDFTCGFRALTQGIDPNELYPKLILMLRDPDTQVARLANWALRRFTSDPVRRSTTCEELERRLATFSARRDPWSHHAATDVALSILLFDREHQQSRRTLQRAVERMTDFSAQVLIDYYGKDADVFRRQRQFKSRRDRPDEARDFDRVLHGRADAMSG